MTRAARQFIQTFETLAEEDQREVLIELLRVPVDAGYSTPADEDLRFTADQTFLGYDEREAQDWKFWKERP
jgi:hypothetical protein